MHDALRRDAAPSPPAPHGGAPVRPLRTLAVAMLWTALYVLGIGYSDAFLVGSGNVTLFWPAAGVAFAAVVALGLRWAAIIPLAVLIGHATFAHVPAAFVPFSVLSNLVGSLAGVATVRVLATRRFDSAAGALAFTAGAGVMALVSAVVGTVGLRVASMVSDDALPAAYIKWVLGDLLGILCIAPTLLLLMRRHRGDVDEPLPSDFASLREKAVWAIAYIGSYGFVYWAGTQNSGYALGMVAFPLAFLLWSAFRFEPLWTALGTLAAVFVVTSLTGLGLAAFQPPSTLLDVVLLLGFLNLFATLPLLLLASISDQRRAARRALREASEAASRQQVELERLVVERTRQLDEANRQLEHASQTDALTGLRNRRYLSRQLPLDLAFYQREAGQTHTPPHALFFALADIDHFKRINDTYGHKAGDDVLQQFADVLASVVRSSDYAVRWGGEEFLLVLRPMPTEHVATLGDRICTTVGTHPFRLPSGETLTVTCSVGFAECSFGDATPLTWEQLVELADTALYWVKHHGRNGWAMLRPRDGLDLAGLAARTSEGAEALVGQGIAELVGNSGSACPLDPA